MSSARLFLGIAALSLIVSVFPALPASAQTAPPPAQAAPQEPAAKSPEPLPAVNIDVVVTAPRIDVPLRVLPAAISIVSYDDLKAMPRGVGAEEAFKLVPLRNRVAPAEVPVRRAV